MQLQRVEMCALIQLADYQYATPQAMTKFCVCYFSLWRIRMQNIMQQPKMLLHRRSRFGNFLIAALYDTATGGGQACLERPPKRSMGFAEVLEEAVRAVWRCLASRIS